LSVPHVIFDFMNALVIILLITCLNESVYRGLHLH
jgi:hypothetical protein